MAELVFQTGWLTSNCIGSPDTMVIFNETNPTALYLSNIDYSPIPFCGVDLNDVDVGCCLSSLNLTSTFGYLGYSRNYLTAVTLEQSIPKDAIGQSYCHIQSINNGSLFGNQEMYIKTTGKCLENHLKCYNDRLEIYSSYNCADDPEYYLLGSPTNISSLVVGNVTVSQIAIAKGLMVIVWTAFVPGLDLIPNFSEPLEVVSLLLFIASIVVCCSLMWYLFKKYRLKKRRLDYWHIICTVVMILKMVLYFIYQNTIFTSDLGMNVYTFIITLTDVASLLSNITSCMILFTMFNIVNPWVKTGSISGLVVVHFALYGLMYYCWFIQIFDVDLFMAIYGIANLVGNGWIVFSMCFNYISPLLIIGNVVKVQYYKKRDTEIGTMHKDMHYTNWRLYIIVSIQILLGIFISLTEFDLQNIAKSDRQYLALGSAGAYLLAVNFVLLVALFEELTNITKAIIAVKEPKQSKKPLRLLDAAQVSSGTVDNKTVLIKK
ncbi:hypothetical protein HDV01_005507 [Terramyces sp. JEL0728]|nr:hypothetical protein HDV01_005507 [Terramyces sp. JEL0728]